MPIEFWSFGDDPSDPVLNLLPSNILVALVDGDLADDLAHKFELQVRPLDDIARPIGGGQPDMPVYWFVAPQGADPELLMARMVTSDAAKFAAPIFIPPGGWLGDAVAPLRNDLILRPRNGDHGSLDNALHQLESIEDSEFADLVPPFRRLLRPADAFASISLQPPDGEAPDGWWFYRQARSLLNDVAHVEPNWYRVFPLEGTGSPGTPWNLDAVNIPKTITFPAGASATVAVIDTGFDLEHPALAPFWVAREHHARFTGQGESSSDAGLSAKELEIPPTAKSIERGYGHGTAVAGVIAEILGRIEKARKKHAGDDGCPIRMLPIRTDLGSTAEVSKAIGYARTQAVTEPGVRAINMSFSAQKWGKASPGPIEETVRAASVHAIACAAAGTLAGVADDAGFRFPASMDEVIAVGAAYSRKARYDGQGGEAWFSPRGKAIDVMAPGFHLPVPDVRNSGGYNRGEEGVELEWMGAEYKGVEVGPPDGSRFNAFSGTSGATPHVSCLAAALCAKYPMLTPEEARAKIERSCNKDMNPEDLKPGPIEGHPHGAWAQTIGYGLINFAKTLD